MSLEQATLISLSETRQRNVAKLTTMSHDDPMNFADALPWSLGLDRRMLPRRPEHSWMFGTKVFDQLTAAQRSEVLWLEVARDVSMFIFLEQILPALYMGFVNLHPDRMPPEVLDYLMIFSKEEIVHTMVFRRYLKAGALPQFPSDGQMLEQVRQQLSQSHPAIGIIYTLILEWVAELGALHSTQDEDIDPLTRELFRRHHVDESRHLAFGRWIAEAYVQQASETERQEAGDLIRTLLADQIKGYTYNPAIALFTSFEFPVASDDEAAIEAIRNSPQNIALNKRRFAPIHRWLAKLGLE